MAKSGIFTGRLIVVRDAIELGQVGRSSIVGLGVASIALISRYTSQFFSAGTMALSNLRRLELAAAKTFVFPHRLNSVLAESSKLSTCSATFGLSANNFNETNPSATPIPLNYLGRLDETTSVQHRVSVKRPRATKFDDKSSVNSLADAGNRDRKVSHE